MMRKNVMAILMAGLMLVTIVGTINVSARTGEMEHSQILTIKSLNSDVSTTGRLNILIQKSSSSIFVESVTANGIHLNSGGNSNYAPIQIWSKSLTPGEYTVLVTFSDNHVEEVDGVNIYTGQDTNIGVRY